MESQPSFERKLTAILYADVAGYSRLTGDDEDATHARLREYLDLVSASIESHRGQVIHYAGDAVLAKFPATVDALSSARNIQNELNAQNQGLPDDRKIQFRIGVNLGDVIEDRGEIYGDGVNVAARLEQLAEPGGICVSESVRAAIGKKLPLSFEFMGDQHVKNIADSIRTYRVLLESGDARIDEREKRKRTRRRAVAFAALVGVVVVAGGVTTWLEPWTRTEKPASVEPMALPLPEKPPLPLPEKPSIAVLPFTNMSDDPNQEYFGDGMVEDLITDLSKLRGLFVIARNSSQVYKGKAVDVRQIGRELGVRYVLEGSVRKVDDQVRITAQLIDATTGDHVWATRYDRQLADVLAMQDEIRNKIVTALDVELVEGEQARVWRESTENLEAYELFLRAREADMEFTKETTYQCLKLLEGAVELDPNFVRAWVQFGWCYDTLLWSGWTDSRSRTKEQAFAAANRAITLDEYSGDAHTLLGNLYVNDGDYEKGIAELDKGIALNPNSAKSYAIAAFFLPIVGRHEEALAGILKAMRLNPNPPGWYFSALGSVHLAAGRYEESIAASTECVTRFPDHRLCNLRLILAYMATGREGEARSPAQAVLRIDPKFSVSKFFLDDSELSTRDPAEKARRMEYMREAGLPG